MQKSCEGEFESPERIAANACNVIEGDVTLNSNLSLDQLQKLARVEKITGSLLIEGLETISDLSFLANLQYAGSIHISSNPNLLSFSGLNFLKSVGRLEIRENANSSLLPPWKV